MTATLPSCLSPEELQQALLAVDPAARLIASRNLRRVIKLARDLPGLGLQVPHSRTFFIAREDLLRIVDREDIGTGETDPLPETVILIAREATYLSSHSREESLVRYWSLLFHARVHVELDRLRTEGKLPEERLREFVARIGETELAEVHTVLLQENMILPPGDLYGILSEFLAVYLQLKFFARPLLHRYFPGQESFEPVDAIVAELFDASELLARCRLPGAPEPVHHHFHDDVEEEGRLQLLIEPGTPAPELCQGFLTEADQASARGNNVRAALLRMEAIKVAPGDLMVQAVQGAQAELDRLVARLQGALQLHDKEAAEWRAILPALLAPASRGYWPPAARLLYDLQKTCVDSERDLYAVDLVESVLYFFRRPVRRRLPYQAEVLRVKHLRTALKRLGRIPVGDQERRRLRTLLHAALHHCEQHMRDHLRPVLLGALDEVGFVPRNYAETVARQKVVEELLDRVVEKGAFNIGDLRDAVSRNQIKLDDVRNPIEWLMGDRLLKADHKLTLALDGVYKRGEFYMRWLQRFSSLLFGTLIGRLLTLHLLLPFLVGVSTVIVGEEMVHLAGKVLHPDHPADKTPLGKKILEFLSIIVPLAIFTWLIIHVPRFRRETWKATKKLGHGLKVLFWDWPAALLTHPLIMRFIDSRPVFFFRRYALLPVLSALLAAFVCRLLRVETTTLASISGGVFVLVFLFFLSRLGRRMEENAAEWLARNWYWLTVGVFWGLILAIIDWFKAFLDGLDKLIYTVDEWLVFRAGESKTSLVFKAVAGFLWFFVTYLVRVLINVFIEPSVNPIKHFPAVTVTGKLILPLCIPGTIKAGVVVGGPIAVALAPTLGLGMANTIAGLVLLLLPGLGGFMVWEFKENWKLYRANRSPRLRPVMIGSHGETMLRFMRPGLHSGTLPKLYAKLRRAERRQDSRAFHRHYEALHHVKESIAHFVERELVLTLEHSKCWGGPEIHVGEVRPAINRVRVELACPSLGPDSVWLSFEERAGWLIGSVVRPGWLEKLSPTQRTTFTTTLAGLYKLVGVNLVREQVQECVPPARRGFYIDERGLVVRDGDGERVYPLLPLTPAAEVPAERLVYDHVPILWDAWVANWESDQTGNCPGTPIVDGYRVLPVSSGEPGA